MPKKRLISVESAFKKIKRVNVLKKKYPVRAAEIRQGLFEELDKRKTRLYRIEEKLIIQKFEKRASKKPVTKVETARASKIKIDLARIELLEILLEGSPLGGVKATAKIKEIKYLQKKYDLIKGSFKGEDKKERNARKKG